MRVLLLGEFSLGEMAWFIKRALLKEGFDVVTFNHRDKVLGGFPLKKAAFECRRFRPRVLGRDWLDLLPHFKKAGQSLIRTAKVQKPDLVLVTKGETLSRDLVKALKEESKLGVINWFPDNPFCDPLVVESLSEYTLFFVKDPYILEELKKLGSGNVRYLPHACDPGIHQTLDLNAEEKRYYGSQLSFVGSMYPYRISILEQLSQYEMKIWGSKWDRIPPQSPLYSKHQKKVVVGFEQAAVFNASAINLNTHHPNDIEGVNQRVFDIAGSGGFQLVDYKKGIRRVFETPGEIVTYRSLDELKELVEHFLQNPDERARIARRAQERAQREHTYTTRIREILEHLKVRSHGTCALLA